MHPHSPQKQPLKMLRTQILRAISLLEELVAAEDFELYPEMLSSYQKALTMLDMHEDLSAIPIRNMLRRFMEAPPKEFEKVDELMRTLGAAETALMIYERRGT